MKTVIIYTDNLTPEQEDQLQDVFQILDESDLVYKEVD